MGVKSSGSGVSVNMNKKSYQGNTIRKNVEVIVLENRNDMPMGFAFQLSMNEKAMENFAGMSEEEKQQVLDAARSVTSKQQMRGIVSDLAGLG